MRTNKNVLLAMAVVLLLAAAFYAFEAAQVPPTPPAPTIPLLMPSANPSAFTVTVTATSESLPGDEALMGLRWDGRTVVIDNQVGAWFTPILQAAVDAWNAAGSPVQTSLTFGGAPACDSPPVGVVVICFHATESSVDPDTGQTVCCDDGDTQLNGVSRAGPPVMVAGHTIASALSGTIWLHNPPRGHSLATVTKHEVGHAEGLGLSQNPGSVMYLRVRDSGRITAGDLALLQALYASAPPPSPSPTPSPTASAAATPAPPACHLAIPLLGWCLLS